MSGTGYNADMMRPRTIRIIAIALAGVVAATFAAGWDTVFLQQVWADWVIARGCYG